MPFLPNLYKLAAFSALVGLLCAQRLSPLTSATVGVAVLYALLARFT